MRNIVSRAFNIVMQRITGCRSPGENRFEGFRIQRITPDHDTWMLGADGWCHAPVRITAWGERR